jgi:exo-1,4-beta-D-glucosaminidase
VPTTVIGALVTNGVLPDPYFGMNLRSFPGETGVIGDNLTGLPMPPDSPFAVSWWYRTEFQVPRGHKGRRLWLNFDSINYRANIWLNGQKVAGSDQVVGMYRGFEFDVTGVAVTGANVLAVEVFAPQVNDFTITFVDWNPLPPDKDMGVVRDVYILTSGAVAMRNVQVETSLDDNLEQAHLTIFAGLTNAGGQEVAGILQGTIGSIQVSKPVQLAAGQRARIAFDPQTYQQLNIQNPPLWWPYGLGPQNLEQLHMEFTAGGTVSDSADVQFGIRQVTSVLDANQHRLFRINGKPILIRGGGWTHDMMLRIDPEREENEIRYARDMHLNALRLEGKMWDDHFYDLAGSYGILVMPGWCCCGYWEQTDNWSPSDYTLAGELLRAQVRRLRNHPSVFVFLYCSDARRTRKRNRSI